MSKPCRQLTSGLLKLLLLCSFIPPGLSLIGGKPKPSEGLMRGWCRRVVRDASGAAAPIFALGLVVFLGMGALAWDVSRGYALRAELDAAVDAAALAGATQLDGNAGAIERARAAAQGALVSNSQALANARENNVVIADTDITFLSDLSPRTTTGDETQANFIQIDLSPRQLGLVLGAFARTSLFNVRAHAVAGYGLAICKVQPLFVCNPLESATVRDFDPNQHIGKGMILMSSPGNNTWGPGNFGYVSVTGEDGIKEAMGRAVPRVQCFGSTAQTQPGRVNAANQFFNTRFGYYEGSANSYKNDPEFLPSQNTITGRGNACSADLPTYT
jgi:hypothetical protein